MSSYQRTSVALGGGRFFDLYRTGLFVVTGSHGQQRENVFGTRVRSRSVLARGRMRDKETLRVTRGPLTSKTVRELLHAAGYPVKVVSGGRR